MQSKDAHMELVASYLNGTASKAEVEQLEKLMQADAQLRKDFLLYSRMEAALPSVVSEQPALLSEPKEATNVRSIWNHWQLWIPAAAAIFIGSFLLTQNEPAEKAPLGQTTPAKVEFVATFAKLNNCRWMDNEQQFTHGSKVQAGQRIQLSSGSAELIFDSGAKVQLRGPSILEARSDNSGFLVLGEVDILAETESSKGFKIETPSSTFVDISTAFTASVSPDGLSKLEVSEGEVDVIVNKGDAPKRLKAGEIIFVEPGEHKVVTLIESGQGTPSFTFPSIPPPSNQDYADLSQKNASAKLLRGSIHSKSGPLTNLINGKGQPFADAPKQSVFFELNSTSHFMLDLGSVISVERVNTYSWHQHHFIDTHRERATQSFELYGFAGSTPPQIPAGISAKEVGWSRIARVHSDRFFKVKHRQDRPAQQASSITGAGKAIGEYRYLLWIANKNTFFGEIDVYATP